MSTVSRASINDLGRHLPPEMIELFMIVKNITSEGFHTHFKFSEKNPNMVIRDPRETSCLVSIISKIQKMNGFGVRHLCEFLHTFIESEINDVIDMSHTYNVINHTV